MSQDNETGRLQQTYETTDNITRRAQKLSAEKYNRKREKNDKIMQRGHRH